MTFCTISKSVPIHIVCSTVLTAVQNYLTWQKSLTTTTRRLRPPSVEQLISIIQLHKTNTMTIHLSPRGLVKKSWLLMETSLLYDLTKAGQSVSRSVCCRCRLSINVFLLLFDRCRVLWHWPTYRAARCREEFLHMVSVDVLLWG